MRKEGMEKAEDIMRPREIEYNVLVWTDVGIGALAKREKNTAARKSMNFF